MGSNIYYCMGVYLTLWTGKGEVKEVAHSKEKQKGVGMNYWTSAKMKGSSSVMYPFMYILNS